MRIRHRNIPRTLPTRRVLALLLLTFFVVGSGSQAAPPAPTPASPAAAVAEEASAPVEAGPPPLPEIEPWLDAKAQFPTAPKGLKMKWKTKVHRVPDIRQRRAIVAAMDPIIETIQSPVPALIRTAADKLAETGYELREYYGPEGHWLILRAVGNFAGGGYYLFRTGRLEHELMIQAPHAIHDLHTDLLTKEVFRSLPFRAAFFSDYQRYGGLGQKAIKNSPYDMAHNPDTLFQDLTIQWMLKRPRTIVLQPHAFAPSTVGDSSVDIIISPGTRNDPGPLFASLATSLTAAFPEYGVRVYPKDIRVLGGTTNQQGKAVRAARGEFVHIELSLPLRKLFKESAEARRRFGQALIDGMATP